MADPAKKVVEAWVNPGKYPAYHYYMRRKLSKEWPMLARAIRELVRESRGEKK
jgi:hypothetical protein